MLCLRISAVFVSVRCVHFPLLSNASCEVNCALYFRDLNLLRTVLDAINENIFILKRTVTGRHLQAQKTLYIGK